MKDASTMGYMAPNTGLGVSIEKLLYCCPWAQGSCQDVSEKMVASSTRCWFCIDDKCKFEGVTEY